MIPFASVLVLLVSLGLTPPLAAETPSAAALVGPANWNGFFPFRLGDSWTYDWKTSGTLYPGGVAVRTRTFDGTSFIGDTVGYKLVSDDGTFHLYTFERGVLAIHSSLEAGRYFDYDPAIVIAAPDMQVGDVRVTEQQTTGRRWKTTFLGVKPVTVPFGAFEKTLVIQVDMEGPDYSSTATHYFAPHVGLVAYHYVLQDAQKKLLVGVDAQLRLARLGGVNVTTPADLARLSVRASPPSEDRALRDQLRAAMEKRYTWNAAFPGFRGDVELVEPGKPPVTGRFVVGADLSVRVESDSAAARVALQNEISSFVTQRKPTDFDVAYAQTTFVRKQRRPDGALVVVAAEDPLMTSYTIANGEIVEVGRSMGRVSYVARDRSKHRTDDGRLITIEYDVVYTSNENDATLAVEHTRDGYITLGSYWVPSERRVERQEADRSDAIRELKLSNLRLP
jgi:hypothetical protein